MSNDYGEGVSRVLDPTFTQFLSVIWQEGLPPLDSEFNLSGDLATLVSQQQVLRGIPSGWLSNDVNPSKDFVTDPTWSNWFQFGRQRSGDKQSIMWANISGWLVPVSGTQTASPPGNPDNLSTWNKILLDPPPASAGDARCDFVFLEVWRARIQPFPSTLNKPNGSAIYKLGNVEGGFSFLADDLLDPEIGEETTERIQLQYRIRVVKGLINLSTNPDGFDPAVVKAQGTQATPPSVGGYTFTNMREELGDVGLWRAGDGTQNSLGTVDGFVYAIPICCTFRRNSILWSGDPSPNLNGGFNRNPTAVDRTGTLTFSTVPTLAVDLSASATSLILVSASNIPLPASSSTPIYIQIGDEILSYSGTPAISGTTVSGLIRGVRGTIAEIHKSGAVIRVLSSRPDGLFSDQVASTDILDLRHVVKPAWDYDSVLRSNLDRLLKGQLRATWKRSGEDSRGSYVFYEDKISAVPPAILGITQLDAPDGIRTVFSDAAVQQPVEVICAPVTLPATFPTPGTVSWGLTIQSSILVQSATNVWSVGDQVSIPISQFKSGVPVGDDDQIRFLNDQPASGTGTSSGTNQFIDATKDFVSSGVELGDTLVIFAGAATGSYIITQVTTTVLTVSATIPTAIASTYAIRKGVGALQIRVEGQANTLAQHNFTVSPPNPLPTDDLTITFVNAGGVFPTSGSSNLYVTTHIQYGGGRGLSRRPDSIHNVVLTSSNPQFLTQLENYPSGNYQLRTAWAPLWSKFRSSTYKSLLPVTSESYADLGSKTVALAPWQAISLPAPTTIPSPIMPTHKLDGITPKWIVTDPLGAFDKTQYVTLPRSLVPGWSAVQVPILPTSGSTFHRGINFGLMAQEGIVTAHSSDQQHNQWYINYFIGSAASCAILSTINLQTSVPATYNGALSYGGHGYTALYAGSRLFNDDPTVIGALPTARGLGRQGIELPPFYACARIFGIYEAQDYRVNGSAFNVSTGGNRLPVSSGGATNLLRQNFNGPVFFLEIDDDGDTTTIISAEVIDISKSPNPISSFSTGNYVVEASIFGFDRGSFDLNKPFRLALVNSTVAPTLLNNPDGPNTILPGPLSGSDTALINYSRSPYQFDAWQTASSGLDKGYTRGPLLSSTAYQLSSTELNAQALTRPNQKPLEVLASIGFVTTLGTGRLSGDFSLANSYDIRNVGYEDPTDPLAPYPPLTSGGPRPLVKSGALGSLANYGDIEASPELLGLTERLPLGALYRDKDFHGSRFSDELSSPLVYLDTAGVGSGVAGMSASTNLDQTEVLAMPAGTSAGVPGDVLVAVDGEQSNYSALTNYRTNRGGSAFMGSGDRPGGELFATYSRLLGSGKGTRVLVGRAFLVRNAPTFVGATQVSAGDELMLAIATQVMELGTTPIEAMVLLGTNGTQEGFASFDVCRIEGHPIITNHTFYDVDPSTIQLPLGKTIAQITAPSPAPAIPIGANHTVYASDGFRNFWTNIPTLTGLNLLSDLDLGGNIVFTATDPFPQIFQADAAPGVAGVAMQITTQKITPTASTTSGFSAAPLLIYSAGVNSASAGWYGNSGMIIVSTGNLDANTIGNSGDVNIETGNNNGTGASGAVHISTGVAYHGDSGQVTVGPGPAFGPVGNGGNLLLFGGTVTNGSNPSGNGGDVQISGGNCGTIAGNGGNIHLNAGSGPTNGYVDVLLGSGVVRYAQFTNLNLIIGPQNGGSSVYGLQFSAITNNPRISQAASLTGNGENLTIQSQDAFAGNSFGGNLTLNSGAGTGTAPSGHIFISTGSGSLLGQVIIGNANLNGVTVKANDTEEPAEFGPLLTELGDGSVPNPYSLTFSSRVTGAKIGQKATPSHQTLTVRAANISSNGNGGNLRLEGGDGLGVSTNGGDIILLPGAPGSGGSNGVVAFDAAAVTPTITQKDTGSGSGKDLTITAQATTLSGFSGGNLTLNGGNGDFTGGNVSINGGGATSGTGGSIILNSGGLTAGTIDLNPGGFSGLRVDSTGVHVRQGSGNNQGLGFQAANPPPTSLDDGGLYVGNDKHLDYVSGISSIGDRKISANVRVANYRDTSLLPGAPITSLTYVDVISSGFNVPIPSCAAGDIIEGVAFMRIVTLASFGHEVNVRVVLNDGPSPEVYEMFFNEATTGTAGFTISMPIYYVVSTGTPTSPITVHVTLQALSSDGTTAIQVFNQYTDNKWLNLRHIRP